jgi:Putative auto-transporter adhesin, head GIN domain
MKRGIILSAFILAISVPSGFAMEQSSVKETREVKDFTKVSFGVAGNLYINIGPEFKVVLEGDKKDLEEIITDVSGGRLVIKKDNNWRFNFNDKVTVYITMPELKGLGVSGSGKAEIKDAVKAEDLDLSVSGSGKIFTTDLMVSKLGCSISGSGDIVPGGSGTASKADISISGSGNYEGGALKIESAEIHISGSGNCSCNVIESLRASVSGSGNVTYEGNPKVDAHVSGSGKVRSK